MKDPTRAFSFSGRIRSIAHAASGIRLMLCSQHNAWVHLFATVLVIVCGAFLSISASEWCLVTVVIVAVWTAEALNTSFEFLCDAASPEFRPLVKKAKDVAAGAVLISAAGALAVGVVIFLPKLLKQ